MSESGNTLDSYATAVCRNGCLLLFLPTSQYERIAPHPMVRPETVQLVLYCTTVLFEGFYSLSPCSSLLVPRATTHTHPYVPQHLVQEAKTEARNELLKDPRLLDLFMAASAPAAVTTTDPGGRPGLSAPQAADIVWACGLLRWRPSDDQRLGQLAELVAKAARSDGDLDGWHVTNVVWALDRLGALAPAARATVAAAREDEEKAVIRGGDRGTGLGFRGAAEELRNRVAVLPFRAIPSLFEGLRVEDFREEVAFGRDEILLGGGKVSWLLWYSNCIVCGSGEVACTVCAICISRDTGNTDEV